MQLKSVKIGNLHTKNNVFLAPLAGYSNAVFREMCYKIGAGLTFTEMVSAKGLCYDSEKTRELLAVTEGYDGIRACQIFGAEPCYMRRACESEDLALFDLIDINMGCPVPKIYKNGEGSALLNDLNLASRIISECKKSGKNISVKFRTGIDSRNIVAVEFAKMCEDSGADMICIHGRTRDKMYSGDVDFKTIAEAKAKVKIPVIANGGVFDLKDAERLLSETGADGIAVARGAIYSPWVFAEITGSSLPDKKTLIKGQIAATRELYGEKFATVFMRKMVAFYIKGMRGASEIKKQLLCAPSTARVEEIVDEIGL